MVFFLKVNVKKLRESFGFLKISLYKNHFRIEPLAEIKLICFFQPHFGVNNFYDTIYAIIKSKVFFPQEPL